MPANLSTTSYAILGQLNLRPWTAYELTKHLRRNLHYFFPRAESGIYGEFKKLVAQGLATGEVSARGNRRRTTYTITPAGREALSAWLATSPERAFALDSEGLLRVMYAPAGTLADLRRTVAQFASDADEMIEYGMPVQDAFLAGEDVAQRDAYVRALLVDFTVDYLEAVIRWSERTGKALERWDSMGPEGKETETRRRFQQGRKRLRALLNRA